MLGAEDPERFPAGELTWTLLVVAGVALYAALKRNSAICLLIAAIAGVGSLLAAWEWVFAPGIVHRLALAAAAQRGRARDGRGWRCATARRGKAELLIDAAGLAILVIGVQGLLGGDVRRGLRRPRAALPDFWELIVFGAGVGLIAFGALDRSPGPAWLGLANLVAFIVAAGTDGDATLYFWPLALLLVGAPDAGRRAASARAAAAGAGRLPRGRAAAGLPHRRRRGGDARARRRRAAER